MKNNIRTLSEQQVLEKLGIPDFRHLSKDKITTFFSMMPSMNTDVEQKAIEQFPVYAGVVKDVIVGFKELLNRALTENSKLAKQHYDSYNDILNRLLKKLENDDLPFEEERYIIDKILEIKSCMKGDHC